MIPGSELTVIENAGHWPQWEQVDAFNDVIINYFTEKGYV